MWTLILNVALPGLALLVLLRGVFWLALDRDRGMS